jgi:peptidoglycan/LPS O-acetylase OafA/YrhL
LISDDLGSLLRICIALLCIGAMALIWVILSGERLDEESGKALATAVVLAFLSLAGAAGANLIERQPGIAAVGHLTLAVVLVAFAITAYLIWHESFIESTTTAHWAWYSLIGAFALGNTSALLAGHDDADPDSVKLVRLGTVAALWALVVAVVAEIHASGRDVDPRLLGVTAVVYGLGVLVLPLLRRVAG